VYPTLVIFLEYKRPADIARKTLRGKNNVAGSAARMTTNVYHSTWVSVVMSSLWARVTTEDHSPSPCSVATSTLSPSLAITCWFQSSEYFPPLASSSSCVPLHYPSLVQHHDLGRTAWPWSGDAPRRWRCGRGEVAEGVQNGGLRHAVQRTGRLVAQPEVKFTEQKETFSDSSDISALRSASRPGYNTVL